VLQLSIVAVLPTGLNWSPRPGHTTVGIIPGGLTGNPSERVISKATVLGGIVFFPGYTPNDDICGFGGDTNFYADYYETGTAYYKHILPGYITTVNRGWRPRY
jgi:hypothetical protein